MDKRLTFDKVPEIYDRVRPQYPRDLFDLLFAELPPTPRIVEVGPGTGQATEALLDRNARVTAVELGPQLASFLRDKFADRDSLEVVNASFEDADLEPHSFDAVVVATAYHWIESRAQIERPIELLVPTGCLAVIEVIQVESPTDLGYFDRVQPIYDAFNNGKPSTWRPMTHDNVEPPIASHLELSQRYRSVAVHRMPWNQTYSSAQYRDLLWTYSGTLAMSEPDRSDMVEQLVAVIDDEFGGVLTRPLSATMTLARPN